jgi:uncharacterized protein (UPF0335 family)
LGLSDQLEVAWTEVAALRAEVTNLAGQLLGYVNEIERLENELFITKARLHATEKELLEEKTKR